MSRQTFQSVLGNSGSWSDLSHLDALKVNPAH
jgi:hypothetical protein